MRINTNGETVIVPWGTVILASLFLSVFLFALILLEVTRG